MGARVRPFSSHVLLPREWPFHISSLPECHYVRSLSHSKYLHLTKWLKRERRHTWMALFVHLHLIQCPMLHMQPKVGSLNIVQWWKMEGKGPQTNESFSFIAPDNTPQTKKGLSFHSNSQPLSFTFKTIFIEKCIAFKLFNVALK